MGGAGVGRWPSVAVERSGRCVRRALPGVVRAVQGRPSRAFGRSRESVEPSRPEGLSRSQTFSSCRRGRIRGPGASSSRCRVRHGAPVVERSAGRLRSCRGFCRVVCLFVERPAVPERQRRDRRTQGGYPLLPVQGRHAKTSVKTRIRPFQRGELFGPTGGAIRVNGGSYSASRGRRAHRPARRRFQPFGRASHVKASVARLQLASGARPVAGGAARSGL